jgi:hypothetical protein
LKSGKFFKAVLILTVFLTGVVLLTANWTPQQYDSNLFILMVMALAVVTSIVHIVLVKVSEGKPQRFIRVFMIATMTKLLVYLLFILFMAFTYRQQVAGLLIAFFVFYICYTTLEVIFLRKHLDSQGS